nr:hypothetical protein [Tanacetum cinerariifolium]
MIRSVLKGMSRLVPEGVSRSVPEGISRSVLEGMSRSVPEGMSRSVPKGMSRSVPKGASRSVPEGMSRSVPKGMSRSVPKGMSRSVPEGISRSVPEGMSRSVLERMSRSVPKGMSRSGFTTILAVLVTETSKSRQHGDDNNDGDHPKSSNTSPPVPPLTQQIPHTILSIKLPILKKGEYDIWAIKMEHYLSHIDYPIWQVIHNENGPVFVITDTNRIIKVLPPKTAEEVVARERERKARTTLLVALPEDHLAKFHKMADAKEMWEAIKSRFENLHKRYDRFQTLLSQLEIHGAGVSHEDANQKFLSFDDLYNNLRVFEHDVKGATVSSSNTQNVVFVSIENTSSTNDINNDDMDIKWQVAMISMRIKKFHKRTGRKLQVDTKDLVGFDKTKVECFNCHKIRHFARDCKAKGNQDSRRRDVRYNGNKTKDNGRRSAYQDDSKALVIIDGEDIDWSGHIEKDAQNYAMMAYSSSNSDSDNNVKSCSKACEESYARIKKLYDDQRDKLGDASVEITVYTLALKRYGSIVSYENEVLQSVFMNKISDLEDTHTSADESDSKPSEYASCESDSGVETSPSMPEPIKNASKVVCEPKVWTDAPIIEDYELDSDNDSVSNVQEDKEKPFTDSVKHVKTSRENIKETGTTNHIPKIKKQDRNGHTRKGLRYAFTRIACFVCGSFSHLIRDCDFHEKRMAKQAELTKSKNKVTSQRENRPVWKNVQRVNHQNKALKDKRIVDSGCSKHMTGNKAHLADYQEFKGGFVAFGGSNGRITGLISCKELASPKQTALGKDISNPLMAGRLPKTTLPTRFVQLLIDHHLGDMSHHKEIYDNPSLTNKVFANMKRVGTGLSGSISIPTKPSTYKKHKPKKQQTQAPKVPSPEPSPEYMLPLPSNDPLPSGKDSLKLKELTDLCTQLSNKVLELESEVINIKSTYKERIEKLKSRVDRLEEGNMVLKELHIVHSKVDIVAPVVKKEKSFKQGRIIADIDEDVEINLEEAQAKPYKMDLEHPKKILSMKDVDDEEPAEVEEVLEVVTAAKLITKVVTTAKATTTAEATKVSVPRRRMGVGIQDPEETTSQLLCI